jgi:formate dehydrogenase subunit gamma
MPTYPSWSEALATACISEELTARRTFLPANAPAASALLPLLHALQHRFGYLHADAVPLLATTLNLSKAEVRGVISFYSDFRVEPPPSHVIKLCRAEACQAVGSERLATHLTANTAGTSVHVEAVMCLGNCALGPSALVDDELIGRLDETRVDRVLETLRSTS